MRRVYRAANLQEAYLILHRLQHAGIPARIFNEHLAGGLGDLPFTHVYPEIWVEDARDAERALSAVREYEAAARAAADTLNCPRCGEENPRTFELCWQCAAPLEPPPEG
ncbi:DUF2007 domain-containing protein [Ectothiorhodospiraceae bacterium 2226]|nr:DUF2007 domain-containing protein [Ectothiorhodospiraceae bacterium 2226]